MCPCCCQFGGSSVCSSCRRYWGRLFSNPHLVDASALSWFPYGVIAPFYLGGKSVLVAFFKSGGVTAIAGYGSPFPVMFRSATFGRVFRHVVDLIHGDDSHIEVF